MISAVPFENLLGKIRNVLRSEYKPMEQLCNRMQEKFFARQKIPSVLQDTKVMREKICLVDPCLSIIERVLFIEVVLSLKSDNNMVSLRTNNVCFEIRRMYHSETFRSLAVSNVYFQVIIYYFYCLIWLIFVDFKFIIWFSRRGKVSRNKIPY